MARKGSSLASAFRAPLSKSARLDVSRVRGIYDNVYAAAGSRVAQSASVRRGRAELHGGRRGPVELPRAEGDADNEGAGLVSDGESVHAGVLPSEADINFSPGGA